jgi:hypothetical protein
MSALACAEAEAFGIGTGTGMSTITCADAEAFGIGTGTGMSVLTCADAAVINKIPKMNVPMVLFKIFLLSSHTAPESLKTAKIGGPEFKCTRWSERAKGRGLRKRLGILQRNCTQTFRGSNVNLRASLLMNCFNSPR